VRRWMAMTGSLLGAAALLATASPPAAAVAPPAPPFTELRLALLPIDNLSGGSAPVDEIHAVLAGMLAAQGITLVDAEPLRAVLASRRTRWVGGVDAGLGRTLWEEQRTNAVLVTNLDMFEGASPPRIGLSARLVRTGPDGVQVLWATAFALAGEEQPGLLELKLVEDPGVLTARALERLAAELGAFLQTGVVPHAGRAPQKRFRPRAFHAAPEAEPLGGEPLRVAVLPFSNDSSRRQAGEIVSNRSIAALVGIPGLTIVEPGEVRRVLLETRMIQEGGLTYAQAELLRGLLGVDLVLTGTVFDYSDPGTADEAPMVGFTTTVIDARRRQVASVSFSHGTGRDGVRFFDVGEIRTADRLADELLRGVADAQRR